MKTMLLIVAATFRRTRPLPCAMLVVAALTLAASAQTTPPVTPGAAAGVKRAPNLFGGLSGGRTGAAAAAAGAAPAGSSAIAAQLDSAEKGTNGLPALKFDNAASDLFLQLYAMVTGKTMLIGPDVPKANITLRSQTELSREEYLQALENVLLLHGIALIPSGETFMQVVPSKDLRTRGVVTAFEEPKNGMHPETGRMVSQMITLKSILIEEAKKAIEGFKRSDGQIQTFERTNSILITDTQENVNRIVEIIKFIDQPLPVTEEVFVRTIKFAKSDDIKKRIEEMVAESQKQQEKTEAPQANQSGSPGISRPGTTTPGIIRPTITPPAARQPNTVIDTMVSDADRGMIRGKVQIISDERSNQLIIITRKENMNFFDRVIEVLDIATSPDVRVKIIRLQYASVEGKDGDKGVAELLNDLIGNTSSAGSKDERKKSVAPGRNENLTDTKSTPTPSTPTPTPSSSTAAPGSSGKNKIGELNKDNIKILSDKRINALIVMASPSDIETIEGIVKEMDIQLAQVLLETVVMEVSLSSDLKTGMDWLFGVSDIENGLAGVVGGGAGTGKTIASDALGGATNAIAPGITYFMKSTKLNAAAVLKASQSDGRTKVLSSPILMTQDNKEATIDATELTYLYKGKRYVGYNTGSVSGGYEDDIEQRDVGLTVKITPRISPNGLVMLTVDEKFEEAIPNAQSINGTSWPSVTTRKITADVSVATGETVVLGGLVKGTSSDSTGGIPFLKDLPWVGPLIFGSATKSVKRSELLVFLTPYVFNDSKTAQAEAVRRKDYLNAQGVWSKGWSSSDLADPMSSEEITTREMQKWAHERKQIEARDQFDKLQEERKTFLKEQEERSKRRMLFVPDQQSDTSAKEKPVPAEPDTASFGLLQVDETVEIVKPTENAQP